MVIELSGRLKGFSMSLGGSLFHRRLLAPSNAPRFWSSVILPQTYGIFFMVQYHELVRLLYDRQFKILKNLCLYVQTDFHVFSKPLDLCLLYRQKSEKKCAHTNSIVIFYKHVQLEYFSICRFTGQVSSLHPMECKDCDGKFIFFLLD